MARKRSLTPREEIAVIQYRKRKFKRLHRLFSVIREIEEADPDFYVRMEIMVPHPTFDCPKPCVFVLMQRATQKMWFRLKSPEDLKALFGLNEQDIEGVRGALERAEQIAERLNEANKLVEAIQGEAWASLQRCRDNSRDAEKTE